MRGFIKGTCVLLWLLLLLFVHSFALRAQNNSPQPLFDRANDQLQSGNFQQALSIYKSLEQQGTISGPLFLNMGISYIQLDSLGKAKYYFMKARQFEEVNEKAQEGLQYTETHFSRQSAVLPKLPWERFFEWLDTIFNPDVLLGIGIILLNIGIYCFVFSWFLSSITKLLRIGGIGTGILSLLLILSGFYLQYRQNRYSQAVMVHQQTNVLEQPSTDASIISQAYEGYTFTVDNFQSREKESWSYVRMSNGLYGWISNDDIMIL